MSEQTGGFFALFNEPCADRTDGSRREPAHNRPADGLDAYGERRDSPGPKTPGHVSMAHKKREETADEQIFEKS